MYYRTLENDFSPELDPYIGADFLKDTPLPVPRRVHLSYPFQQRDCVTCCNEDLLPEITVCNVIGPHICWGSLRVDWATVSQWSSAQTRPRLTISSGISRSRDAQSLIVLSQLILSEKGKTRKWGQQVTDKSTSAFPLKSMDSGETWDG